MLYLGSGRIMLWIVNWFVFSKFLVRMVIDVLFGLEINLMVFCGFEVFLMLKEKS